MSEAAALLTELEELDALLAKLDSPYRRPLLPAERFVDLEAISGGIDQTKGELAAVLEPIQRKQAEALVKAAQPTMERAGVVDVADLPDTDATEMQTAIFDLMQREYERGRELVAGEARRQGKRQDLIDEPIPERNEAGILSFFRARAQALTGVFTLRMKASLALILNRYAGLPDVRYGDIVDELVKAGQLDIERNAGEVAIDPVNIGRAKEAFERRARTAIYSALLDDGTCEACGALDGQEFEVGSAEYWAAEPPNRKCAWPPNCRCVFVWEFGEAYWREIEGG